MKKILSLVLVLTMVLSALVVTAVSTTVSAEDTEPVKNTKITEDTTLEPDESKVFHIYDAADLWRIMNSWFRSSKYGNYKGYTILLENDIDLNPGWDYQSAEAPLNKWVPIYNFQGTFDGQGHVIKGLYTEGDDQTKTPAQYGNNGANAAFIATLVDATLKNVRFENASFCCGYALEADATSATGYKVTSTRSSNAGVVSCVKGKSTIDGVILDKANVQATVKAGGILAYQYASDATKCEATVKNCVVTDKVTIAAANSAGGIVASTAEFPVNVSNCACYAKVISNGNTTLEACAGGIIGRAIAQATVNRCFFGGSVVAPEGKGASIAVVVDYADDGKMPFTVTDTYALASLTVPAVAHVNFNGDLSEDQKMARNFGIKYTDDKYVNPGNGKSYDYKYEFVNGGNTVTYYYNLTDALATAYAGSTLANTTTLRVASVPTTTAVTDGAALLELTAFKKTATELTWTTHTESGLVMSLTAWEVIKGHDWDDGVVKKPDCTNQGYTTFTCKNCATTKKENYVKADGHKEATEWTVEVTPVAGDAGHVGKQVKKCTVCQTVVSAQLLEKDGTPVNMTVYTATEGWAANSDGVFEIATPGDLLAFINNRVANGSYNGKKVVLTADIDLNPEWKVEYVELGILPANTYTILNNFQGTFDGQGHTIAGLYQKTTATNTYAGFIQMLGASAITPCTIKNVKFDKCYFENTWDANNSACALFAYVRADGVVLENIVSNAVCVGTKNVGGIVGRVQGTATDKRNGLTVKDCVFTGSVKGITAVGGIMASTDTSIVANCAMANAKFINCANYGKVEATTKQAGGIVGLARGAGFEITNCVNAGEVISAGDKGLIFGYNTNGSDGTTVKATNCYAVTTEETPVLYTKYNKDLAAESLVVTNVEKIAAMAAVLDLDAFKGSETSEKWYLSKDGTMILPLYAKEVNDGHTFDSGLVTAPSCSATGFTTYTCQLCQYSYTDNVTEKTAHSPEAEWTVNSQPTYTRAGAKSKKCTVCQAVVETEIIPKLEKATEAATEAPTAPASEKKGGCGATVTVSAMVVTLVTTLGTCLIRKKH